MNTSYKNETFGQCFLGSCSYLNLSTCMQLIPQVNITTEPLAIDEDGCFNNTILRSSAEYQKYKLVSIEYFRNENAVVDSKPQVNYNITSTNYSWRLDMKMTVQTPYPPTHPQKLNIHNISAVTDQIFTKL